MSLAIEPDQRSRFHQRTSGRYLDLRRTSAGIAMVLGDHNLPASGPRSGRRRLRRRLAAILGADIVSYSALMERNEEETHRRVGAELDRFRREVEKCYGRIFS